MPFSQAFEIMKKSAIILLHVGFWVCYFILIAIMLAVYYRSNLMERK